MNARIDRMKIGIVGLTPGAGAGFVSVCLAGALAETGEHRPAVLELGDEGLYDSLAMDKHLAGREYFRFFKALRDDKSIRGRSNELYGVNWILKSPAESGVSIDLLKMIRLANHASGDIIICKIPDMQEDIREDMQEEDLWKLLWDMDRVLIIIDPLPSKMLAGHKLLCVLRASGLPLLYIVNKMNGGVARRELLDYLKLKKLFCFPLIEPEIIYGAEYSCRFFYDLSSVKSSMKASLDEVIKELFSVSSE